MRELIKFVGALAWLIGLLLVFLFPPLGLLFLFLAVILSILSIVKTREHRHQELLDVSQSAAPRAQSTSLRSTSDVAAEGRLTQLQKLREDGLITEDEYQAKRQQVIDGI